MFPTEEFLNFKQNESVSKKSQSLQVGSMFPTPTNVKVVFTCPLRGRSQSPQVGSMFPTGRKQANKIAKIGRVAIPSSRVNVSYSTHLFLRIIGNLTPLLREPHYFYAFFFPL